MKLKGVSSDSFMSQQPRKRLGWLGGNYWSGLSPFKYN